jgi:hypothetical protein
MLSRLLQHDRNDSKGKCQGQPLYQLCENLIDVCHQEACQQY